MTSATATSKTIVSEVDQDVSVRESLDLLIAEAGWRAKAPLPQPRRFSVTILRVAACIYLARPPWSSLRTGRNCPASEAATRARSD
jgi:hypothetical protein